MCKEALILVGSKPKPDAPKPFHDRYETEKNTLTELAKRFSNDRDAEAGLKYCDIMASIANYAKADEVFRSVEKTVKDFEKVSKRVFDWKLRRWRWDRTGYEYDPILGRFVWMKKGYFAPSARKYEYRPYGGRRRR